MFQSGPAVRSNPVTTAEYRDSLNDTAQVVMAGLTVNGLAVARKVNEGNASCTSPTFREAAELCPVGNTP